MHRLLLTAALVVASSPVHAAPDQTEPSRPKPSPPLKCMAKGDVVLQIDRVSDNKTHDLVYRYRVYSGGAWTAERTVNGKTERAQSCLGMGVPTAADLKKSLAVATWKQGPISGACTLTTGTDDRYIVDGKTVYTVYSCGGGAPLDAASEKAFKQMNATIGKWYAAFEPTPIAPRK